ncbi:hypothetical protein M885DRAFT_201488 [Pelagophyceae sp. CCMP2097]|nr:hypothetical protein M885DRAFT_201488 [Pelagophyceae sp. CCMP2097]
MADGRSFDAFDPLVAHVAVAQPRGPDHEYTMVHQFSELTGLDPVTSLVHVRAARSHGSSLAEAVDAFYANGGRHVTPEPVSAERRAQNEQTALADAALARSVAATEAEQGCNADELEMAGRLEEMGFAQAEARRASKGSKTLADATNILLHEGAPQQPPQSRGAPAAEAARAGPTGVGDAMRVRFEGRLWKLSRASGLLGARWQARGFVIRSCELAYDGAKRWDLWGCYALREPDVGRDHAFGVYAAGNGRPQQLAVVAADDAQAAQAWLRALYAAAGRDGVLTRAAAAAGVATLRCVLATPRAVDGISAAALGGRMVVVAATGAAAKLGLRVDDVIVEVDGNALPPTDAAGFRAKLRNTELPCELTVMRRPASAASLSKHTSVDLLALDDFGAALEDHPPTSPLGPSSSSSSSSSSLLSQPSPRPPQLPPPQLGNVQLAFRQVVDAAHQAVEASRRGDAAVLRGDAGGARREYDAVVQLLLRAQPEFAASDAARRAVAAALPGVSLAALYDEAVAKAAAPAQPPAPPPQPPRPAPAPAARRPQLEYRAAFAFEPGESWQLALAAGEPLAVVEVLHDGWSDVFNARHERGLVPSSYVVEPPRAPPA